MSGSSSPAGAAAIGALLALAACAPPAAADEAIEANTFVEVGSDQTGGHYFSQVIYAPTARALVSWGTRTHARPIRAHETQHFVVAENQWLDAWPAGKAEAWAGKFRTWGDWEICGPVGRFYERDGVKMPRPNSSFHQVCWDGHNRRVVFYLGSMTFSYDPAKRTWKLIHAANVKAQPPAMLLWGSLCYDPVNRQVLLFGGGGVDAPDGRPHTWAMDARTDAWRKLPLDVEPPARCNSRMVCDARNKLIVLFGGDGQDRALADTWVFDVTKRVWHQRRPKVSPSPRHCHAMAYLPKSGRVLLVGGKAVADDRDADRLSRQVWTYDAAKDTWTPMAADVPKGIAWASMEALPDSDEVVLVTAHSHDHRRRTFRFRLDPAAAPGKHKGVPPGTVAYKTRRTKAWQDAVPPPDREAHGKRLAELPVNTWVEMTPPKSTIGRTWGSALFDTDRGVAMKWGGGHSGYQGTDMAFYDVAANRFSIDRTPAFTPEPFGRWSRRPKGRTFFNQPWTHHMRHTCAYDRVRKVGVFTDAGGATFYRRDLGKSVKVTWLYDPAKRAWLEPIRQPFPGGASVSPIAVPTPDGVIAYQHGPGTWHDNGELYRFAGQPGKPQTWRWRPIKTEGPDRPHQREHMTIVYDSKRHRLIFLSHDSRSKRPVMWFFSMADRKWVKATGGAAGGVSTREAVYVPDQDAVLAYGPAAKDDEVWTRAYLCAEDRWVALPVKTPRYTVHEVALEYDPVHKLAVLLWPPGFERDLRPHVFRLDVAKLPAGR